MSLLRLLTAGKSLVGLKNYESRYRLPGGAALPKFGSKKNPFRATVVPERSEGPEAPGNAAPGNAAPDNSRGGESVTTDSRAFSNAKEADKVGSVGEAPSPMAEDKPKEAPPPSETRERPSVARSGVGLFPLWGRAKRLGRLGAPFGRPLVQGELTLDHVKVVRNDLSESDVEVVRAEPTAVSSHPGPLVNPLPKASRSPAGWGAAAGRLFGLGKM